MSIFSHANSMYVQYEGIDLYERVSRSITHCMYVCIYMWVYACMYVCMLSRRLVRSGDEVVRRARSETATRAHAG